MIRCERCGLLIRDGAMTEKLRYEIFDGRHEECWEHICPACGGDDFVPMKKCAVCGEYFPEDEMRDFACEECRDGVIAKFAQSLREFNVGEMAVLASLYNNDRLEWIF